MAIAETKLEALHSASSKLKMSVPRKARASKFIPKSLKLNIRVVGKQKRIFLSTA
jgi:hypothetical protein